MAEKKDKRIIYSLVARGEAVLAEETLGGVQGNFTTVTRVLLSKIGPEDNKLSYVYDK
jgi:vesicle-associated membrane protein 7